MVNVHYRIQTTPRQAACCLTCMVMTDPLRCVELPENIWHELVAEHSDTTNLRYVVGKTRFTGAWRVALVRLRGGWIVGAAVLKKFGTPGRGQDGLEFKTAEEFGTSALWSDLSEGVRPDLRTYLDRDDGEAIPPQTSRSLEAALTNQIAGSEVVLGRLEAIARPESIPGPAGVLIREQQDATALGLEIGGLDSKENLDGEVGDGTVPFLRGMQRRKVREASALRQDWQHFGDWLRRESDHVDMMTFEDPDDRDRRMTIIYADKEELEEQTGTDLIYYHHHRPGFILVQYKRMRRPEASRRASAATYFPDRQLSADVQRYLETHIPTRPSTADEWRLTKDAFFIKLVADDVEKSIDNKLVRGLYLPLDLVDLLLRDAANGQRVKGWSQDTLPAYLSNDEFIAMAKQGYIRTRSATTDRIQEIISRSFEEKRSVTVALDETDPTKARRLRHG